MTEKYVPCWVVNHSRHLHSIHDFKQDLGPPILLREIVDANLGLCVCHLHLIGVEIFAPLKELEKAWLEVPDPFFSKSFACLQQMQNWIQKKPHPNIVTFHGLIGFHSLESFSMILVTLREGIPFDNIILMWRLFF